MKLLQQLLEIAGFFTLSLIAFAVIVFITAFVLSRLHIDSVWATLALGFGLVALAIYIFWKIF